MSKWISVNEAMPEDRGYRGHVLVARTLPEDPVFGCRDVTMGYHSRGGWRDDHGSIEGNSIYEITHWMPIPDPPPIDVPAPSPRKDGEGQ